VWPHRAMIVRDRAAAKPSNPLWKGLRSAFSTLARETLSWTFANVLESSVLTKCSIESAPVVNNLPPVCAASRETMAMGEAEILLAHLIVDAIFDARTAPAFAGAY
jgi:tRNA isopentenyl-2-thiomethyl-A-37 hydroxylase MiaE